MAKKGEDSAPKIRQQDEAASGVPRSGWAIGDRFSWQEIQHRLLASASEEITSHTRELIFSSLTAGIAITLTLIGYAVGTSNFPDNIFLGALLYPLGFIYIILGRFQLYTENTLPPVALILSRLASIPSNMAYFQSVHKRYPEYRILSLRDWLIGMEGGRQFGTPRPQPPNNSD